MAQIAKLKALLMSAFGPAFAIVILALFAGYAVLGSNGILAWGDYSRALATHRQELQKIKAERDRLKNRVDLVDPRHRSEEHTSELQSLMRISYAVFCLKNKKTITNTS